MTNSNLFMIADYLMIKLLVIMYVIISCLCTV